MTCDRKDHGHKCKWCHGTGRILVERKSSYGYRCPDCDGSGVLYPEDEEEHNVSDEDFPETQIEKTP